MATAIGQALTPIRIGDFSGGLNTRDAPTLLADNETPNCWNVVLDERGGAGKRLGYSTWNAVAVPNLITFLYESKVCGQLFHYSQADGILYRDGGNGVLTSSKTLTSGYPISVVDFAGSTYLIHSVDGLFSTTNGITWNAVSAASGSIPSGDQLAVWQNKLWVANSNTNLLTFSAPGDPQKWDSTDDAGSNYIREGNDFPIICLYGAAGADFQTNPSLIVGKAAGGSGSLHRVTDASTADYVTLDQDVGPASAQSIKSLGGMVYVLSVKGIYETDGVNQAKLISGKITPFFSSAALSYGNASKFCIGVDASNHRICFDVVRRGSTVNDLSLEYHPQFQAFTARSDAMAAYVSYTVVGDRLLGASPTVTGQVYRKNSGGDDDGAEIQSRFLTRVFEPAGGFTFRAHKVACNLRGSIQVSALLDYAASGDQETLSASGEGFTWDSDGWDDPLVGWGEQVIEGVDEMWQRPSAAAIQIRVDETSTLSTTSQSLLETGAALPAGAWALYGIQILLTSLGPS